MTEKPEVDAVEQTQAPGILPPDEHEWWQKQLGKPVEALEPEPALR